MLKCTCICSDPLPPPSALAIPPFIDEAMRISLSLTLSIATSLAATCKTFFFQHWPLYLLLSSIPCIPPHSSNLRLLTVSNSSVKKTHHIAEEEERSEKKGHNPHYFCLGAAEFGLLDDVDVWGSGWFFRFGPPSADSSRNGARSWTTSGTWAIIFIITYF